MKKVLISIGIVGFLMLTACDGKKTENDNGEGIDSLSADTTLIAEPSANLHTEDAIKAQIQSYYDELNKVNDGEMRMRALDSIACTKSLLAEMKEVEDKSIKAFEQGSDGYFEDEGFRWFQGLGTPFDVTFDDITDPEANRVEVYLTLQWKGQTSQVRLRMELEDGVWKIDDFADYDLDGVGFRTDMDEYLGKNTNDIAS
ncbi:MAG: hypothetical protein J5616_06420 [Bacteroidaceae bacterium]|nr:hypothetical protein [Bacteroidaceae bacterium]